MERESALIAGRDPHLGRQRRFVGIEHALRVRAAQGNRGVSQRSASLEVDGLAFDGSGRGLRAGGQNPDGSSQSKGDSIDQAAPPGLHPQVYTQMGGGNSKSDFRVLNLAQCVAQIVSGLSGGCCKVSWAADEHR